MTAKKTAKKKAMKGTYLTLTSEAKASLSKAEGAGLDPNKIASNAIVKHIESEEVAQAISVLNG